MFLLKNSLTVKRKEKGASVYLVFYHLDLLIHFDIDKLQMKDQDYVWN